MERLLLLIGFGVTLCLLLFVSVAHFEDSSQADLAALSKVVPDDPWYQEQVLDSQKPVLVEFTADWCVYCKQMEDVLREVKKHYGRQLRVVAVDVDKHPNVSSALQIEGLPSVMLVKNRKIVAFSAGMMRYETLEKFILPHLKDVPYETPDDNSESASPESAPENVEPQAEPAGTEPVLTTQRVTSR